MGRIITTDHISTNFFHASHKFVGYTDFIDDIQCIGNKSSDFYLLDYLKQFSKSYKNTNKFSYIHMSQGHEFSGTVIKTIDNNLQKTLEEIINYYYDNNQDFFIILAGDHGKHSIEWDHSYEGYLENQLPALFFISNKQFLSKIDSMLYKNRKKVVSRFDLHLTLKHLAISPYGKLSPDSVLYKF